MATNKKGESSTALEGKKAPVFALADRTGKKVRLSDMETPFVVVYFYPKDDTPGCTVEALGFERLLQEFEEAGATVVGISGGDEKSKEKFCRKHGLTLPLLSDPDGSVGAKYGAFGEKKFMGRVFQGFLRKTFVLGKDRRVLKVYDSVKADGHAEEVLRFVRESV